MFLIGEEQILAAQEIERDPDPIGFEERGLPCRPRPRAPHLHGSLHGARGLALAGLGAGAVAILAALELGGGEGPARPHHTSSPRSPLISRSAATLPAEPTVRVHHPAPRPAEVHRPTVNHHRPRHPEHPVSVPIPVTRGEPEREPTHRVAPVSSPAVTGAPPARAPEESPAAAKPPTPPDPPPSSSSGGGPGGVEDPPSPDRSGSGDVESFGFER